jgi:hypothetical protein
VVTVTASVLPDLLQATVTLPSGQARWVLPSVPRVPYATGVQVPCVPCAAKGRDRKGLPDRFEGDPTPMCKSCWTAERRKRDKAASDALVFDLVAGIWEAEEAARCEACGQVEPSPRCWLCSFTYLARARAEHEREVAGLAELAAEVEAARLAEVEHRFARIAAVTTAEERVRLLEAWIARCRVALTSFEAGGGMGRPV